MANIITVLFVAVVLCSSIQAQYSPPVNTPNDCPIRCITYPCPCGASCDKLQCPSFCQSWKLDSRNCNTCECDSPDCPLGDKPCVVVRCASDTVPKVITPDEGCPRCECAPKEKSGVCPAPSPLPGICVVRCTDDSSCPGDQKCCGGCPRDCTNPAKKDNVPKAGKCPRGSLYYYRGLFYPYVASCTDDSSCPGNQKCCGSYRKRCADPENVIKEGLCPAPGAEEIGPCVVRCEDDSSCPGIEKCCGSCPRECALPI